MQHVLAMPLAGWQHGDAALCWCAAHLICLQHNTAGQAPLPALIPRVTTCLPAQMVHAFETTHPGERVFGLIPCPARFVPWVNLVLVQAGVPAQNFLSNMCGMCAGMAYAVAVAPGAQRGGQAAAGTATATATLSQSRLQSHSHSACAGRLHCALAAGACAVVPDAAVRQQQGWGSSSGQVADGRWRVACLSHMAGQGPCCSRHHHESMRPCAQMHA